MNEIVKFLLAGDKFMPEMYLKQPGFAYSACRSFTKNKEKVMRNELNKAYRNELDKACFEYDLAYADFKDLARRTALVLRDKAFNIVKNPKYDGYQRGLESTVYKFFDKKPNGGSVNNKIKQDEQLAEGLLEPIKNFLKRTICCSVKTPSISGLATNSALTAVEDKTPNVSNVVKKNLLIMIMINILLL